MAFNPGSANGITKPESWFGISTFKFESGAERTAWDAAHGTGNAIWRDNMQEYQNKLDPDGSFKFNQDARWNGALVSFRTIDGGASGTTAHGPHDTPVDEISWRADPDKNGPSFLQSVEAEFDARIAELDLDLEDGKITEVEFAEKVKDARIEAQKDHIAFTKTMEAGYLRQDILDRAGHTDIKHIAITDKDPEFADRAAVNEHNESIRDFYSKESLAGTIDADGNRVGGSDLYHQNRALVDAEFDAVLRQDTITIKDISDADKRLNVKLVENLPDYARIFPEVPTPDSVRARILAEQKIWQSNPDNPKQVIEDIKGKAKAEVDALEQDILKNLRDPDIYGPDSRKPITFEDYQHTVATKRVAIDGPDKAAAEIRDSQLKAYNAFKLAAPDLARTIQDQVDINVDEEIGKINELNTSSSIKAGATVGVLGVFFAGLAIYTKYRNDTVEAPQPFDEYLARQGPELIASSGALSGLIGGLLFTAAVVPGGSLIVLALGVAGGYVAFKEFLQNYIDAYRNREGDPLPDPNAQFDEFVREGFSLNDDGDFTNDDFSVNLARNVLTFLEEIEDTAIARAIANIAKFVGDKIVTPYFEALTPEIKIVNGYQVDRIDDKKGGWLVGEDISILFGSKNDDVLFHFGSGQVFGREGDDWLVSYNPDFLQKGDYLLESDRDKAEANKTRPEDDQIEITGPIADRDYRLTLDGGKGDDYIITLGGTGAITVGGEGRDFIFNTSAFGQIYGDTISGMDAEGNPLDHTSSENADTFWYWPGTFIQDVQPNDRITLFGIPLVGGSNSIAGIPAGDGSAALDFFSFGTYYTSGTSGQLAITNLFARYLDIGPEGLEGVQIVENYDFGGFSDESYGRAAPGDLGLTFRIFLPADRALEGVVISLFNAVWGSVFAIIDAAEQLAKLNLFFFIPPQPSRKFCY